MIRLATIFFLVQIGLASGQIPGYVVYDAEDNLVSSPALHENRVNLVILAEGYADNAGDFNQFKAQKEAFLYQLFEDQAASTPFSQYRDYFEVHVVWVTNVTVSGMGCTDPCDHNCPSEFGNEQSLSSCIGSLEPHFASRHDRAGWHRFALPDDSGEVLDIVQLTIFGGNTTAPLTIAILANSLGSDLKYRAGGTHQHIEQGDASLFVVGSQSNDDSFTPPGPGDPPTLLEIAGNVCVHELGHSFANLLDEYWYDMEEIVNPCVDCNESYNRTANSVADSNHPWWHWLDPDFNGSTVPGPTIGINQISGYTSGSCSAYGPQGFYKPTPFNTCKMENPESATPFCAVCKEQIVERIHGYVQPYDIDMVTPAPSPAVQQASSSLVFDPAVIEPNPSWMEVKWYVNYVDEASVPVETIEAAGADVSSTETDFTWTFDCTNEDLIQGENTIRAYVFDHTGFDDTDNPPPYTADTRMVRRQTHKDEHADYYVEWKVNFNGEAPDLMIRDFYQQLDNTQPISDVGTEPWQPFPLEGWYFDYTSDIKVTATTQSGIDFNAIEHASPLASDITAYVNVRVTNIGCTEFTEDDKLHLYTSTNGGGLSWPTLWQGAYTGVGDVGYEITHNGTIPVPATIPDIQGGASAVVEIPWYVEDMTDGVNEDWNPCLIATIEGVSGDDITAQAHLTNWIRYNNNIAMRNLTVDEPDGSGQHIAVIGGRYYSGGYTYLGNTGSVADTIDIYLQRGLQPAANPEITEEAEVILYFHEAGWDVSAALEASSMKDLVQLDSTLFLATSTTSTISGLIVPGDTVVPIFVGFAFLTEEVGDSMNYVVHLNQRKSAAKDTVTWAQHYLVKRNARTLFTADAGADVEMLMGDTITLTADGIGEDALYFWLNGAGEVIGTGDEIEVSPSSNTTYTLEAIAEADGYKDYDAVNVTVTHGLITNIAPNPASSTTTVYYETTGVSTVRLKVVEVGSMMQVDVFTVTAGTGSRVITVSGYNTGAHIITLEGDSQDLDSETLMVQ